MQEAFEFRTQARRPGTYLALGVGMSMGYIAWLQQAPAVVWGLVAFFLVVVLIRLAVNRNAGLRLTDHSLEVFVGRNRKCVELGDLESVRLVRTDAGAEYYALQLANGRYEVLPPEISKGADIVMQELRQRGIKVLDGASSVPVSSPAPNPAT